MANLAEEIARKHGLVEQVYAGEGNIELVGESRAVAALNDMLDCCIAECHEVRNDMSIVCRYPTATAIIDRLTALKG